VDCRRGKEQSQAVAGPRSRRPGPCISSAGEAFGPIAERYLGLKAGRPKTITEARWHLLDYLEPLHGHALGEINRRVIADQLAKIEAASGAVTRNRVRSSLSTFFRWAIAAGLLADDAVNPVTKTLPSDEGGSRKRVLSDPELVAVWRALPDGRA
jgi:integrase